MKREFHICRKARDLYHFDESIFAFDGDAVLANFYASRVFAHKMNEKRDLVRFPEKTIRSGQINAMGLIDEILHYVIQLYREQIGRDIMNQAWDWLVGRFGLESVQQTIRRFTDDFPPVAVYRGEIDLDTYLKGETDGMSHWQVELEEMAMLWLENTNPAFSPYLELFDHELLEKQSAYREIIVSMREFFDTKPPFGPDEQNLVDMLRSPAIAVPHSLTGQLEYIRERWGTLLGKFLFRLLGSLDLVREEEKMRFLGSGESETYTFTSADVVESERYSHDRDWMPRTVLIAKSTYVWLYQLSQKYQREISRLDQIPDQELDTLARWGFTGLWLIGLWERSKASQRIKQLCGNPEAVASAYSLFDYQIAEELGGEAAFQNLKQRAWKRGIRMAGDMVPNHVGIDAKWVIEHPDWFVALDYCPYPSYSFNGQNLSWDDRVGIHIEDHYFSRTDASVVFKRVDHWTGSVKYVYHGNDGTSMPWNDTAQLNYLNPEVREAVIQTILHVARKFPIIRFDAAMTLTKRHFQRLWFPHPGTGGDIPTRAEHGLTTKQFDDAMPEEFWREVVDRVAQEIPDTLLLAEAFWLMEGYFVRTLGMHRVYNSAFMNMLKAEENSKYRSSIKNVLEFDPEILKRFVNFMNNPDEQTAIAQFGKDDKYIGVSMMMVTMPGLPMFGHGQVEGYTEKYGMEYRRAYWDEHPDDNLIQRHEREIFPLMRKRYLFADVQHFLLYDFFAPEGYVNENVFAYSNQSGSERALVIYNNKFDHARGWVRTSSAYSVKTGNGDERQLIQKTLGDGLEVHSQYDYFCIFRDQKTGLEFIRNSREIHEKGLYVELGAYQYHVFVDFREVQDNVWHHYANLTSFLDGRGVPNIDEALKETFLQPIHHHFKELMNAPMLTRLMKHRIMKQQNKIDEILLDEIAGKTSRLLSEIVNFTQGSGDVEALTKEMRDELELLLQLSVIHHRFESAGSKKMNQALHYLRFGLSDDKSKWTILFGWWVVKSLGKLVTPEHFQDQSRSWIDEWLFGKVLVNAFMDMGIEESRAWNMVGLIKILTTHQDWFEVKAQDQNSRVYKILEVLLRNDEIHHFLKVNRYQDILWYNKEAFEELVWWLMVIALVKVSARNINSPDKIHEEMMDCCELIHQLDIAKEESGYQVEKLMRIT